VRIYGHEPFTVAVVHGGPGAPGEMAPVARQLSTVTGVLEPLQTATTIEGQVQELKDILEKHGDVPVTLIGFSWGAWLSFIVAAQYAALIKKLILISSGAYEEKYAVDIMKTRLSRLDPAERREVLSLMETLNHHAIQNKNRLMARFGELMMKADSYHLLPHDTEVLEYQYDIFHRVGEQAEEMRSSGRLLRLGIGITCPVVAIHGDYDPHRAAGVKEPLARTVKDFRFILLEKCGHYPWWERDTRDKFYGILTSLLIIK